jgi:hypothetical protein
MKKPARKTVRLGKLFPIKGYEGLYAINVGGTVVSLDRTITNKNGLEMKYKQRVLKGRVDPRAPNNSRYYMLSKNGFIHAFYTEDLQVMAGLRKVHGKTLESPTLTYTFKYPVVRLKVKGRKRGNLRKVG